MTAGSVELGVVMYINKADHKQLPVNMDIMGITPKRYMFKLRGHGSMSKTMTTIQAVMKNTMTNIFIKVSQGSFGSEQMLDITNKLPMEHLISIKGRALMEPTIQQSEFEKQFLKVFVDLKTPRELTNKSSSVLFSAYEPPDSLGIVPMDKITNMNQKGTRRREVQGTYEEYELTDLFNNPNLMAKHGIVILGHDTTTGYGKTRLALRLAVEWAKTYNEQQNLPKEDAKIVFTNTIDVARDIVFKRGCVWVLDDMKPNDREQIMYLSEHGLKVLLNIIIVININTLMLIIILIGLAQSREAWQRSKSQPRPATPSKCSKAVVVIKIRIRIMNICKKKIIQLKVSVQLCATGVPRIFTANSSSPSGWVEPRMRWPAPLERKAVVFKITQPLCHESWTRAT